MKARILHISVVLLTIVYLLIELPFSAELLDAVGGSASIHDVEHMETKGRLLAGFAFALFGLSYISLPFIKRKGWGVIKGVPFVLVVFVSMMAAMYFGQRAFVDNLVAQASPAERKQAVSTVFFTQELKGGRIEAFGLQDLEDPASKAFLAIMPFLASNLDDPTRQLSLDDIIDHRVATEMGTFEHNWNKYAKTYNDAIDKYGEYRNLKVLAVVEAKEQYRAYRQQLQEKAKGALPKDRECSLIKAKLGFSPQMPWDCKNEDQFLRYVSTLIVDTKMKENGWNSTVAIESADQFLEILGVPKETEETARVKYDERFEAEIGKLQDRLAGEESEYVENGPRWQKGEDAIKSLIIPPIALFFSIAGALGHILKLVAISSRGIIRWALLAVVVAGIGYVAYDETPLTQTRDYLVIEEQMAKPAAMAMRGIIQFESWMYPVCSAINQVYVTTVAPQFEAK